MISLAEDFGKAGGRENWKFPVITTVSPSVLEESFQSTKRNSLILLQIINSQTCSFFFISVVGTCSSYLSVHAAGYIGLLQKLSCLHKRWCTLSLNNILDLFHLEVKGLPIINYYRVS